MSTDSLRQTIRERFPIFDQLELVDQLVNTGQLVELEAGTAILQTGSYIKVIPLVLKGSIKVFREDDDDKELFLYYIKQGQSCAMTLNSCLRVEKSRVKAVAQEPTTLLALPVDRIQDFNRKYPSWLAFVMETFGSRLEEVMHVLDQVAFHQLDERLVNYLSEKAQTLHTQTLHISHQAIADDLASSREVISRLLKQLEKNGRVKLSRGQIELL